MSRVERIQQEIISLEQSELVALRKWFAAYEAEVWDRQIEADARTGKLDELVNRALSDHQAGRTIEL